MNQLRFVLSVLLFFNHVSMESAAVVDKKVAAAASAKVAAEGKQQVVVNMQPSLVGQKQDITIRVSNTCEEKESIRRISKLYGNHEKEYACFQLLGPIEGYHCVEWLTELPELLYEHYGTLATQFRKDIKKEFEEHLIENFSIGVFVNRYGPNNQCRWLAIYNRFKGTGKPELLGTVGCWPKPRICGSSSIYHIQVEAGSDAHKVICRNLAIKYLENCGYKVEDPPLAASGGCIIS